MRTRIEYIDGAGAGTLIGSFGKDIKGDFLATLLDRGMPGGTNKVIVIARSDAIVKRFGSQYEGYELCYFGLPESECDIRTGIPNVRHITADNGQVDMVVWARMVTWRDAKAYFITFYDAMACNWRMLIARLELEKAAQREAICHKLADGMKLAFAQFEGFFKARREDEISKEAFREYLYKHIKEFARDYPKLHIKNLAAFLNLNRDTVSKYLNRDPSLLDELRPLFLLHKKGKG